MANVKFCPSCGSPNIEQIDEDEYQCPYCGKTFSNKNTVAPQQAQQAYMYNAEANDDIPNPWANFLSFLLPLAGGILYYINKKEKPICAKSYFKWAIIGIVVDVICEIIIEAIDYYYSYMQF